MCPQQFSSTDITEVHLYVELLPGQTVTFEQQSSIHGARYSLPPEAPATTEGRYGDGSTQIPLVPNLATYGLLTAVLMESILLVCDVVYIGNIDTKV